MEETKESVAEIYAKLPKHKKLEQFIGMVPMVVTVRDDVSRKRFTVTDQNGNMIITSFSKIQAYFRWGR